MKTLFSVIIGLLIAAILSYLAIYESEYAYFWMMILAFAIIGEFALIASMRKRGSGDIEIGKQDSIEEAEKIDFSKNSPTINPDELDGPPQVKPIDLTGNVFEHNFETLEEDLSFLKKDEKHSDED